MDRGYQLRVYDWMIECFGAAIAADKVERADRFVEEALELAQATGWTKDRGHALVDYVFGREVGEIEQEVGGVAVTLASLCNTFGVDIAQSAETELTRITTPEMIAKIRAKQASKPTGSALPIASEPAATWGWYCSRSEEDYCTGPYRSREDAIAEGTGNYDDSFYVCEAINPSLRLAEWIGADRLVERADEEVSDSDRVSSEYDDGPHFECSPEQEKDLIERIKRVCDEWQAAHDLVFTCNTFEYVRNGETITVPEEGAPSEAPEEDAPRTG